MAHFKRKRATIQRWKSELKAAGLLAVIPKGHGRFNTYECRPRTASEMRRQNEARIPFEKSDPNGESSSAFEETSSILAAGIPKTDDEKPGKGTPRATVQPRAPSVPVPAILGPSFSKSGGLREPAPDPEQEMKLRLRERHPNVLVWEECQKFIREDLGKFGLNWADCLAFDNRSTKNPSGLHNPVGYYRALIHRGKREAMAALRESIRVPFVVKENQSCTRCDRSGILATGECCDCAMGRDLARQARWKSERAARENAAEQADKSPTQVASIREGMRSRVAATRCPPFNRNRRG